MFRLALVTSSLIIAAFMFISVEADEVLKSGILFDRQSMATANQIGIHLLRIAIDIGPKVRS